MIQELRRQAADQPDIQKLLWKRQLSQQSTYRAEIHELHTEMLNMKEKSEMKSHLAANMCKIEHTVPSRTVDSEPENVLNTLSPGIYRSARWILPHELETPNRPTSSGLQSPAGAPVQFGPSPQTREYAPPPPCFIPPAQWGDVHGRAGDEDCELFGGMLIGDDQDLQPDPLQAVQQTDESGNAEIPLFQLSQQPMTAARCINGNLVRPDNTDEEPPSTACRQSTVMAPGGVPLGRGPPGYQQSPGGLQGRSVPPPPPPPAPVAHAPAAYNAATYPREWTPLNTRPKAAGAGGQPNGPPNDPGGSSGPGANGQPGQGGNPYSGGGAAGSNGSGGGAPPPPGGQPGGSAPPGNTPPQQTGGAGPPGGAPQSPPGISQPNRHPDPWAPLDRSRKPLPKLLLPSNYKVCSILDMRQILESWYDKSTFAIATWRGDAQRYWLTQVLDCEIGMTNGFKALHHREPV